MRKAGRRGGQLFEKYPPRVAKSFSSVSRLKPVLEYAALLGLREHRFNSLDQLRAAFDAHSTATRALARQPR